MRLSLGSSYSAASSLGGKTKELVGKNTSPFGVIVIGFGSSTTHVWRTAEGSRFGESQPFKINWKLDLFYDKL